MLKLASYEFKFGKPIWNLDALTCRGPNKKFVFQIAENLQQIWAIMAKFAKFNNFLL